MPKSNQLDQIRTELNNLSDIPEEHRNRFFKTGSGEYAEHDKFLGVRTAGMRLVAKKFYNLSLPLLGKLIKSPFNEERLIALFILTQQYNIADNQTKTELYDFYLDHLNYVNNWNLVDSSAHLIVGAHLFKANKSTLIDLAHSDDLWYRRIAIVATWYFIRQQNFIWTIKIAKILLSDQHDLIHKAVGWMLREVGKKDESVLTCFLDKHASKMPRTMLRYAIERLSQVKRLEYLKCH